MLQLSVKTPGALFNDMLKQSIRTLAYGVAPRYLVNRYLHHKMSHQARRLKQLRSSDHDSSLWIEALWRSHFFRPMQKQSEIFRLVKLLKALRPTTICEIGAARCGTTFLLAHAAASYATIITVDLDFSPARMAAVRSFAAPEQRIVCIPENSHSPRTVDAVKSCLKGRSLDVLYIDGDHTSQGVSTDFSLYSSLVRPGGVIVFHDIVPDYHARYGLATKSNAGGVPQFWQEIKAAHNDVEEIVEDYEQDGFGIGLLHWSGDTTLAQNHVEPLAALI